MKQLFFGAFLIGIVWSTMYIGPKSLVLAQDSSLLLTCEPFGYNANCPTPTPSVSPLIIVSTIRSIKDITNLITIALAAATFLVSIPFLAMNILPRITQFFRFLGSLFAFYKKKDPWGIVVHSDFGKPIAGVTVEAFDAEFHELKEKQVTATDGQFDFALPAGRYILKVSEVGFLFPARKKPPITLQNNERMYLGEELVISRQGTNTIPHLVIPMDLEARVAPIRVFVYRVFESIFASLDTMSFIFMFLGAALNTYFVILSPDTLNIVCEILYFALFIMHVYVLLVYQRGVGMVRDSTTKEVIVYAVVRIYEAKTNRIMQTRVTNKKGTFSFFIPKGDYTLSAFCQGYETSVMDNIHVQGNAPKTASIEVMLKKKG